MDQETTAIKTSARVRLGIVAAHPKRMSGDQIAAVTDAFGILLDLLRGADPRA